LELESFPERVGLVEKALVFPEEDTEQFLESKNVNMRLKGVLTRVSSVLRCEICDNALKRLKLFEKVLVFIAGIASCVFLFSKLSPFFSSIYEFFSDVYDFFVGPFEWVGSFLRTAYDWILGAFDSISEYFVTIMEFFEDCPI
jgi:hypothetical protein